MGVSARHLIGCLDELLGGLVHLPHHKGLVQVAMIPLVVGSDCKTIRRLSAPV